MKLAILCFLMAALNVPFIAINPYGALFNWFAAGFCLAAGLCVFTIERLNRD